VENDTVAMAAIPQAASQDADLEVQPGSTEVQATVNVVRATPPPAIPDWKQIGPGEGAVKPNSLDGDQSHANKGVDPEPSRGSLSRVLIPSTRSVTTFGQPRTKAPPSTTRGHATFNHLGRGRRSSKPRQHKRYFSAPSWAYTNAWNWGNLGSPGRQPGPNPYSER
jgi:hypothetical protein